MGPAPASDLKVHIILFTLIYVLYSTRSNKWTIVHIAVSILCIDECLSLPRPKCFCTLGFHFRVTFLHNVIVKLQFGK